MYSTCLYCTRDLGSNEVVETLPIGRRLAFDAAQGRLWVICRRCAKWNLVPFETRLETIDAAERLFRETPMRHSTEHIGLARHPEGIELVRIGKAERREFAAWRYRYFRKAVAFPAIALPALQGVLALSAIQCVAAVASGNPAGLWGPLASVAPISAGMVATWRSLRRRVPSVVDANGDRRDLRLADVTDLWYHRGGEREWWLSGRLPPFGARSPFTRASTEFQVRGPDAVKLLTMVIEVGFMPGLERGELDRAIGLVEDRRAMEALIEAPDRHFPRWYTGTRPVGLSVIPRNVQLAMLMASQEMREREWLDGELALLEREWKNAERLAKLADGLALEATGGG